MTTLALSNATLPAKYRIAAGPDGQIELLVPGVVAFFSTYVPCCAVAATDHTDIPTNYGGEPDLDASAEIKQYIYVYFTCYRTTA